MDAFLTRIESACRTPRAPAAHVLVRVERGRPGDDAAAWPAYRDSMPALGFFARWARGWPARPISPADWSSTAKVVYNYGFPNPTRNRRAQVNLAAPKESQHEASHRKCAPAT
jgi:hypothetical protein